MATQPGKVQAGTITALQYQQQRRDRVNVYLNGAFAFGLPDIEAARLKIGQLLTEEDIARLLHRDEEQRIYDQTLRFLAHRPRSCAEVRQYLREKAVDAVLSDTIIQKLCEQNYLDDRTFAQWWLENRSQFNQRGAALLRQELRQKGVPAEIIEECLDQPTSDTTEVVERLARERAQRLSHADRLTFRRKLSDYLSRRGFSYSDIQPVVQRLWEEAASASAEPQDEE